jgi:hypothetical protein
MSKSDPNMKEDNSVNDMSWTSQELEIWANANLVPRDLLHPSRYLELCDFLSKNKEILYRHYKMNTDEDHYQIRTPPPNEWDKSYELQVIDKRTGNVISILEKAENFELCEGLVLKIKSKEKDAWTKETAEVRNFTKEQNEILKTSIERIGDKSLTRKEMAILIEEIRKSQKKPRKYRQSGHLVDQKLKYQASKHQPSLFDTLMPETQQKIEESRIEVKAEGIKLSYAENKIVHALNLLLYEKSQNSDPEGENFYSGNAPAELVPYGVPDKKEKAPVLKFRPSELYKAFMGTNEYSGADIKFIISTLYQLESKKMLIKYDRVKKVKEGGKVKTLTDRIEDFQSLIKVISFIPNLSDEEKAALDKGDSTIREMKEEIIIALNPIFRDQIDTKFIEFPEDTNRRLVIAAGGHNRVTASMQTLMEWMLREISASRYKAEINEEKLPYILGLEKYIKQNRKKLLQERIEKDIQTIINMGIILSVEKKQNSVGGIKLIFNLNKDYE